MSGLLIRDAGPDDAGEIHRLILALCEYEKEDPATTVRATEQSLRAQLREDSPPFRCLLAQVDGVVVGFALFFFNYSTWRGCQGLYLEDLFVEPDYRKRGIGAQLLVRLAKVAQERGCERMEWVVLDWNTPAIEFYRSLGAQLMDAWTTCRLNVDAIAALASR